MSSDLTQTPLASSIVISDTPSSSDVVVAAGYAAKTARDEFFINIKTIDEKNSWEATCRICKTTIRGTKGVTSNYNRHIKEFHKGQYEIWHEQLQHTSSSGQKKITDLVIVQKVKYGGASSSKFLSSHSRQIELEKSITEDLIIELGLPLSLIERPSFIKFMAHVDPRFTTISRRTLTRTTIPNLYSKMMDGLKSCCSLAKCISLTLDLWSDRRQRAFFAVTGHAIINSEFKSYVLAFQPVFGNHHAGLFFETYETCINHFNIQSKLVRLITDSCSNNIAAFGTLVIPGFESYFQNDDDDELYCDYDSGGEQSTVDDALNENSVSVEMDDTLKQFIDSIVIENESFRLPCYAHTLQLVVKDGMKGLTGMQSALEKISKIAKLSHSSTTMAERFEKIQVCIPKANKTRWNSQYAMVIRIVGIPACDLNEILIQAQHRELCLKQLDYQILNEFISLLSLFAEATTTTQAQNTPSISIVAPSVLAIYDDLLLEQVNIKHTSALCECLLTSLLSRFGGLLQQMLIVVNIPEKKKNKRFYDLFKDPIFLLAPFLDGRFRLQWISTSVLSEQVQKDLSNKIQQLVLDQCVLLEHVSGSPTTLINDNSSVGSPAPTQTTITNVTSSPSTPKRKFLFGNTMKEVKKAKPDPLHCIKDEIYRYLNDDDTDSMILLKSSNNYPTLSKLAIKVLSIPATSAPVECVFSQSGFLFRQHRASMSRTTLQQLTMLKCNRDVY